MDTEFHKIVTVEPLDYMTLRITFDNGITKLYDMSKLLDRYPVFNALKDANLFKQAYTTNGGFGVIWNDDIDISGFELWANGIEQDWNNIPVEEPDDFDRELLQEIANDPESHIFTLSEEMKKQLGLK